MNEGAYVRINSRRIPALLQLDPVFGAKRSGGNDVTSESRIGRRIVARRRSSTRAASLGAGLRSGLIAEQADAGPRAGALLALRIGQEREKAHPKSEALQSRGSL